MYQYTEELKVYGITGPDYIASSNAITGTGAGGLVTDADVGNYFESNKYSTKPNPDYTTPGHGKLTAVDLSTVLTIKTYADVDTMKSSVLSDSYLSTIATHSTRADYYLINADTLQIKLFFNTETNRNNFLNAVKDRPSSQFKVSGVVITTP